MRKIFTERERLVIYLEHAEVVEMTAKAREEGMTLVEWAREALRSELGTGTVPTVRPNSRIPKDVGREPATSKPVDAGLSGTASSRSGKTCVHGVSKGYHC